MHPYVVDRMVQERHDELTRLARAEWGVRAARQAREQAWPRKPQRPGPTGGLAALALGMAARLWPGRAAVDS